MWDRNLGMYRGTYSRDLKDSLQHGCPIPKVGSHVRAFLLGLRTANNGCMACDLDPRIAFEDMRFHLIGKGSAPFHHFLVRLVWLSYGFNSAEVIASPEQ